MRFLLSSLDYPNKNPEIAVVPDSLIVGSAETIYEKGEHTLEAPPVVNKFPEHPGLDTENTGEE